ncbi:sugar isomerase [Arthrobacter sp. YD2]|uniref:SIS domain-containing protein n=1 Tax=Arthrobacter sp. YD2 TaxID=3058046 RepID=UPI0025B30AD8|nr:sugar isomerase [Arthrobacter sp. YD2]MDN3905672.1 sugar isomerase [Arthrobacter sp. YD2]
MPISFTDAAPAASAPGQWMREELFSQPDVWERAIGQARAERLLPAAGKRVAVVGCGTSWFMAQSYAAAREEAGLGETDAFAASEASVVTSRGYDAVVAITRSGTTTEVLSLLAELDNAVPTTVLLGDLDSPAAQLAGSVVALPYADESSVVQTRFATAALAYLLTSLGTDLEPAVEDARAVLAEPVPEELLDAEQFSFLGRGWTVGLAHEAALKMREAVQGWTESYPAMEYRHGPIAIAAPGRVTWLLGEEPEGLRSDVGQAGARFEHSTRHPLAELVRIHKLTLERAVGRGLDPDRPRSLTRSVILEGQPGT